MKNKSKDSNQTTIWVKKSYKIWKIIKFKKCKSLKTRKEKVQINMWPLETNYTPINHYNLYNFLLTFSLKISNESKLGSNEVITKQTMLSSNIYIVVVERTTNFKWIVHNSFSKKIKNKNIKWGHGKKKTNSNNDLKTSNPTRWRKKKKNLYINIHSLEKIDGNTCSSWFQPQRALISIKQKEIWLSHKCTH